MFLIYNRGDVSPTHLHSDTLEVHQDHVFDSPDRTRTLRVRFSYQA